MKDSPQAPSPPDPQATAAAQMGLNADTARLQAQLNRYSVNTPYYRQTWSQSGGTTPDYDAYNKALSAYNAQPAPGTQSGDGVVDPETGMTMGGQQSSPQGQRGSAPTLDQFNRPSDQWSTSYDLTPAGQQTFDQQQQIQSQLAGIAGTAANRVQNTLGQEFNPQGLPTLQTGANGDDIQRSFNPGGQIQVQLGDYGPVQRQLGNYGDVTRSFAPVQFQGNFGNAGQIQRSVPGADDFSADRRRVEEAIYSRLEPNLARDRDALINRTINTGNLQGSEGYSRALDEFNRQSTDARMQAILAGGGEQSRLFGLGLAGGQFANAAQNQAYGQELGRGQFANQALQAELSQRQALGQFQNAAQQQAYGQSLGAGQFANAGQQQAFSQGLAGGQFANQAQQQQYGQNLGQASFANQAQQQQFGQGLANAQLSNQARQQGFGEQAYRRSLPLNETTALMSGSQVAMPNVQPTAGIGVQPVDYSSLVNNQYMGQIANNNAQIAQNNAMTGGLFQLGSAAVLGGMGGGFGGLFGGGATAAPAIVGSGAGMGGFGRGLAASPGMWGIV